MKQVSNTVYKSELAAHITKLSDMYFGVSQNKSQKVAHEFAKANRISVPSSWERNCKARYDWFKSFSSRHNLSSIIPEAKSIAQTTAFNSHVVNKLYDNLAFVREKHPFEPQVFTTVMKVVVTRCRHQEKCSQDEIKKKLEL